MPSNSKMVFDTKKPSNSKRNPKAAPEPKPTMSSDVVEAAIAAAVSSLTVGDEYIIEVPEFERKKNSPAVAKDTSVQSFREFISEVHRKINESYHVNGPLATITKESIPANSENKSRKRRAAKGKAVDDGESESARPSKREDNTSHEDKTVSLDEYWKAKAAKMNIHVKEGATIRVS